MNIKLKSINLELTPALKEFVDLKFKSLERVLKKIDAREEIELQAEISRTTRHHRHGDVYKAAVNLRFAGKVLRAEHRDRDARAAVNGVKEKLKGEIGRLKGKANF